MIALTRQLAARGSAGQPVFQELRIELGRVAYALRAHNLREEALLRESLPSLDASGQERARVISDEHSSEHAELFDTLVALLFTPQEFAGVGIAQFLDRVLNHMAREEVAFLRPDVLSDETTVDPEACPTR